MPIDSPNPGDITRLLQSARDGEATAAESLLTLAYKQLSGLARSQMAHERRDHTLQPTALVHEAWLKLGTHIGHAEDRHQFFAIAAQAMRRILTDYARKRNCLKREGARIRIVLDPGLSLSTDTGFDLVDLDDSLNRLAALDARHARVVELRIFGGLTIAETAEVLGVSHTTVETDWFTARAWLRTELGRIA